LGDFELWGFASHNQPKKKSDKQIITTKQ